MRKKDGIFNNFYLERDVYDLMVEECNETKLTKTAVVEKALEYYFKNECCKNRKLAKAYLRIIKDDSSYEKETNCYYTSEEWDDLAKILNEDELTKKLKEQFETLIEDCKGAIDPYEMYGYGESSIYSDVIDLLSLVTDEIDYKFIANELKKEVI